MKANLATEKHNLIRRKNEVMYDSVKKILLPNWLGSL